MKGLTGSIFLLIFIGILSASGKAQNKAALMPGQAELGKMAARFAPTPLRVDTSKLSPGDRQALVKLIAAGRIFNEIFLKQLWSGNPALYVRLQKDATSLGKARFHYFWINKGPWSDLDDYKAFLPGVPARKPLGANFYPEKNDQRGF